MVLAAGLIAQILSDEVSKLYPVLAKQTKQRDSCLIINYYKVIITMHIFVLSLPHGDIKGCNTLCPFGDRSCHNTK